MVKPAQEELGKVYWQGRHDHYRLSRPKTTTQNKIAVTIIQLTRLVCYPTTQRTIFYLHVSYQSSIFYTHWEFWTQNLIFSIMERKVRILVCTFICIHFSSFVIIFVCVYSGSILSAIGGLECMCPIRDTFSLFYYIPLRKRLWFTRFLLYVSFFVIPSFVHSVLPYAMYS